MKTPIRLIIVLLAIICVFSCQQNLSEMHPSETKSEERFFPVDLKEAIEKTEQSRKAGRENANGFWSSVTPVWEKAYYEEGAFGKFLVVPTQHQDYFQTVSLADGKQESRRVPPIKLLVYKDDKGQVKSYFCLITASSNQDLSNPNWFASFSGDISYYDVTGQLVVIRHFLDGKRLYSESERPNGIAKGGRCQMTYRCYYTYTEAYSSQGIIVFGYSVESNNNCQAGITINGNLYVYQHSEKYWGCVDDASGAYIYEPVVGLGGGSAPIDPDSDNLIGSHIGLGWNDLLSETGTDGDPFYVTINNRCQAADYRQYLASQAEAVSAFDESEYTCLLASGFGAVTIQTIQQGVTLKALMSLYAERVLTAAQKRDIRFGTWTLAIANITATVCIENAY
ncbi:MAG: hypothetical protein J7576_11495, partial [Siphonobacter aquaeclarae]|nr:hypothetical protein [Siphonobacter aquaeclarae]